MNSPVLKIKERLSIVDVISSYINVENAGKNYKAKCPFHNEKTPSFFISQERGTYYCFGCGAKGDIFSFVEHFEGTDFLGSLKILAKRAGVELSNFHNKDKNRTDLYYEIMEEATIFYEKMFAKNKEAKSYLLNRGLIDISISSFRIGYAPESWNEVLNYLINKGFKLEDIEAVGLIKKKENTVVGNKFYDRFRGRIMFPINDSSGRVIAFSGRIFKKQDSNSSIEEAKYLNSPDTPLFNKSNVLFGLDKAKSSIKSRDYSIIVEGQMDLILSHQAGFINTVAVSGTAFTDTTIDNEAKINNLGLVRRLSSNIIFAYDGDDAGIRAVSRSAMIALSLDMQVKVAIIPKGKDPADVIKDDYNLWKEIIKNSVNIISFHLDKICKENNDIRIRGKKIREIIFPFLIMVNSSIEKSSYINEIYSKTGIREESIIEDYENYEKTQGGNKILGSREEDKIKDNNSRRGDLEKRLFSVILWKGDEKEQIDAINKIVERLKNDIGLNTYQNMFDLYEPFSDKLVFEAEKWYSGKTNILIKDMEEIVLNLEEEILNEEARIIRTNINEKENNNKINDIQLDIINYQKIVEKIEEIKSRRLK